MYGEEAVDMRMYTFSKERSALSEATSPWTNEGKLLLRLCCYSSCYSPSPVGGAGGGARALIPKGPGASEEAPRGLLGVSLSIES